jgi:PAS domain-containing protein
VTPLADALLAEMPHATLAIDHENKIVAVNTLALELLNCRQEELEGQHMLSAPLPGVLLDFYQAALKQPGHGLDEKIVLVSKTPALAVHAAFSPAAENWTVMLVTLR